MIHLFLDKTIYKKGSLNYSDDHTAYAMLNMIGKHQIVAHEEKNTCKRKILILMDLKDSGVMPKPVAHIDILKQYFHLYLQR